MASYSTTPRKQYTAPTAPLASLYGTQTLNPVSDNASTILRNAATRAAALRRPKVPALPSVSSVRPGTAPPPYLGGPGGPSGPVTPAAAPANEPATPTPNATPSEGFGTAPPVSATSDPALAALFPTASATGGSALYPTPSLAPSRTPGASFKVPAVNDLTLDPVYQQVLASGARNVADASTGALASAKNELLGYGRIAPDAASNLSALFQGDPNNPILAALSDQGTARAAAGNPNATLNQLALNDQQRVGQLDTDLNDKNLFYSSTRAGQLASDTNQYRGEQATATSDLADALSNIYANVLNTKQSALESRDQALQQAYQNALQLAALGGGAPNQDTGGAAGAAGGGAGGATSAGATSNGGATSGGGATSAGGPMPGQALAPPVVPAGPAPNSPLSQLLASAGVGGQGTPVPAATTSPPPDAIARVLGSQGGAASAFAPRPGQALAPETPFNVENSPAAAGPAPNSPLSQLLAAAGAGGQGQGGGARALPTEIPNSPASSPPPDVIARVLGGQGGAGGASVPPGPAPPPYRGAPGGPSGVNFAPAPLRRLLGGRFRAV